jgi:hypothetical protein
MAANPLIERYRWSVKPPQFWLYIGFYSVVVGLLVLTNWALFRYQNEYKNVPELCRYLYYQLLIVFVAVMHIWTTYNSGSTVGGEIARKTYDFFRLLPLPAWQKAVGILVGRNLVPLLLASVTCLLLFGLGYSGGLSIAMMGQLFFAMIFTAVLLNVLVLLGALQQRKTHRNPVGLLMGLFALLIPILISLLASLAVTRTPLDKMVVHFYSLDIPTLILIGLIALYLSAWVFIGIVRKFRFEQSPLFSDGGALLCAAGYCALLLGLFWPNLYLHTDSPGITAEYWAVSFVPLMLIPFGALRTFDNYLESSISSRNGIGNPGALLWRLVLRSNVVLGLALFTIYAVSAILVSLMSGFGMSTTLHRMLFLFSFSLLSLLLIETGVVYQPLFNKIGMVLGTIFVLYMTLPLLASAIMKKEVISLFSPLGAFGWMFFDDPGKYGIRLRDLLLVNAALCIIPLRLIWKRYRYLLSLRQKM